MGGQRTERKSWGEGALKVGMTALYKEGERALPLPHAGADGRRLAVCEPGRGPSPRSESVSYLGLPASRTVTCARLWLKPPSGPSADTDRQTQTEGRRLARPFTYFLLVKSHIDFVAVMHGTPCERSMFCSNEV